MELQTAQQQHPLNGKWNLYYHLPHNKKWDLSSYTVISDDIDTVEKVNLLNDVVIDTIVKNCMLFVMRDGITPMWEDPKNRDGGSFSYKVVNKYVNEVWKTLFCLLCGETLTKKNTDMKYINGITISPKKNFCIIKVWLNHKKNQNPSMIVDYKMLSNEGCMFIEHKPEF
jgi:hypothetical protein